MALTDFLAAFYPDLDEPIHLRAIRPKGASETPENRTVKVTTTRRKLATDERLQEYLRRLNQTRGLYFVVNAGGTKKKDIKRFNAFFAEGDQLPIPEQPALLDSLSCPPSIRVETLKSVHAYLLNQGGCSAAEWQQVQRRLALHYLTPFRLCQVILAAGSSQTGKMAQALQPGMRYGRNGAAA
jgi:hypothetical protein